MTVQVLEHVRTSRTPSMLTMKSKYVSRPALLAGEESNT